MRLTGCVAILLVTCMLSGCGRPKASESPVEVVRAFVDAVRRSEWDDGALKEAYGYLAERSRTDLVARAERASGLAGRAFEPWEMIVQGRVRLRFRPKASGYKERVGGDTAVVAVRGDTPTERADVRLVREHGAWRIVLTR
ncbi:MAG: hypothetical protein R3A78_06815 [Polyangiales bacterium]|nr:hypothetical protein [Myxococcales bacterium]